MNIATRIIIAILLALILAASGCRNDKKIIQKHEQILYDDEDEALNAS